VKPQEPLQDVCPGLREALTDYAELARTGQTEAAETVWRERVIALREAFKAGAAWQRGRGEP
jgi:hypothetical protein